MTATRRPLRAVTRSVPVLPALVLLLVFLLGPIGYAVYGSLTNTTLTGFRALRPRFVGTANYSALFTDPAFWSSLLLTLVFTVASAVVGQNVLGLAIAWMMRVVPRPLARAVGALVVVAWVMPEIVAAFALYAFFASDGTLDRLLAGIGVTGPDWLTGLPMLSVILANVWRGTAFSMLVYGAALAEIPTEIEEAAQIDGATGWQRFVRVTLPMIRRPTSTNLMLTTLQTLAVFTLIWVMTGGGPGTRSSTLPILAYEQAFKFAQVGYGTAMATVTLLVGAVFSVVYLRLLKPEVG